MGIAVVLGLLITPALVGPTVEAQQQQDALDQDTPALKASDLRRAIANRGQSPDRVVVVYSRPSGVEDAERVRTRQAAGAQVLHSSRALRRDVLRVASGTSASAARALASQPDVKSNFSNFGPGPRRCPRTPRRRR